MVTLLKNKDGDAVGFLVADRETQLCVSAFTEEATVRDVQMMFEIARAEKALGVTAVIPFDLEKELLEEGWESISESGQSMVWRRL